MEHSRITEPSDANSRGALRPRRTRRPAWRALVDMAFRTLCWCLSPVYWLALETLRRLPRKNAVTLARFLYAGTHYAVRSRRQRNFRCLLKPLGWEETDLKSLDRRYRQSQGRLLVEVMTLLRSSAEQVKVAVGLSGEEHLRAALQQGRGVLLLGAHFGNWYYVPTLLAARGYSLSSVVNRVPFAPLQWDLQRMRQRFGIKATALGQGGSATAAAAFARNGIFSTLIDVAIRSGRRQSIPFGPALLQADPGPARLALRHRVPVIFALSEPVDESHVRVRLIPLPALHGNETPEEVTSTWLERLYSEILRRPELWWSWGFVTLTSRNEPPR